MKKILSLVLAVILSASMLAGCGKTKEVEKPEQKPTTEQGSTNEQNNQSNDTGELTIPQDHDKILLTTGDFKMTKREANIYLYSNKLNVERLGMGPTIWVNEVQAGKTFEDMQLEQLRNTLTYIAVMSEEARKSNISLTDEEKAGLNDASFIIKSLHPSINDYYGFTEAEFNKFFETQAVVMKVYQDKTKDLQVDQAKLKELYEADQNYKKLKELGLDHYFDQVRARHILISTMDNATQTPLPEDKKAEAKKKAEELLAKAKGGADFAELAKEHSEDPGSKDNGGEYTFGRGRMVPEFENAAFSLNPGEISDLVETSYGYHIIKLEEKIASTPEDMEKAKDLEKQIIEDYKEQLKAETFQTEFDEVVKTYEVKFDEELFKTMSLSYTVPVPEEKKEEAKSEEKKEEVKSEKK